MKKLLLFTLILAGIGVAFSANAQIFVPKFKLIQIKSVTFNIHKTVLQTIQLKPIETGIFKGSTPFVFKPNIHPLRVNPLLMQKSMSACPEITEYCTEEYQKCKGLIDQFDQSSDDALTKAKDACIYSCEAPPYECFGLIVEEVEDEEAEFQEFQCTGPETRDCTTSDGKPGTQTAVTCNASTGAWVYNTCAPKVIVPPVTQCTGPKSRSCTTETGAAGTQQASLCDPYSKEWVYGVCVALPQECEGNQPSCPSGYTGSYICQNGNWVNQCQAPPPSCEGNPPSCPSGYSGSYVCQNGSWVNQCKKESNCPELDPDYKVCIMADGRYGREYADTCNENTGEWSYRPCNVYINLQPKCTSFTYTEWTSCSNGGQGRTIVTREPYGCAGGDPVTYQTCCNGAEPDCPSGWSGSYTCSAGYWWNTCVPPGNSLCYRGVLYKNVTAKNPGAYAQCAGSGHYENGKFCLDNVCSKLQAWNNYGTVSNFKKYIDDIYSQTVPTSCNPSFTYTQCK